MEDFIPLVLLGGCESTCPSMDHGEPGEYPTLIEMDLASAQKSTAVLRIERYNAWGTWLNETCPEDAAIPI